LCIIITEDLCPPTCQRWRVVIVQI